MKVNHWENQVIDGEDSSPHEVKRASLIVV